MRIVITHTLAPRERAATCDRIRLALGSWTQDIVRIEIDGDGEGPHLVLRARIADRIAGIEEWCDDRKTPLIAQLERLRRHLERRNRALSRVSSAPLH